MSPGLQQLGLARKCLSSLSRLCPRLETGLKTGQFKTDVLFGAVVSLLINNMTLGNMHSGSGLPSLEQ